MRNEDGDFDPESLIIIDWDNAAYGYRAFDILYHWHKWLVYPNQSKI